MKAAGATRQLQYAIYPHVKQICTTHGRRARSKMKRDNPRSKSLIFPLDAELVNQHVKIDRKSAQL